MTIRFSLKATSQLLALQFRISVYLIMMFLEPIWKTFPTQIATGGAYDLAFGPAADMVPISTVCSRRGALSTEWNEAAWDGKRATEY